jgi:thymidylate kinase
MPVVIFCGPDGGGKSTQIKLLIQFLREQGFSTRGAWIRAFHSLALALSRIMIIMGLSRSVSNPLGGSYRLPDLKRVSLVKKLWPYVELFSMLPLLFWRVILPSKLGWIVVSERLTLDTIAALSWQLEDPDFPSTRLARTLLKFIPKDSYIINLDSEYAVILRRRKDTAEPMKFIEIQRQVYHDLEEKLPMLTIDTSKYSITQTQNMIRNYVLPKILEKRLKRKIQS